MYYAVYSRPIIQPDLGKTNGRYGPRTFIWPGVATDELIEVVEKKGKRRTC